MSYHEDKIPNKRLVDEDSKDYTIFRIEKMLHKDLWGAAQKITHLITMSIPFIIFIAVIYLIYYGFIFHSESGYIYHYENMITGDIEVYDSPGTYFKIPFASQVTRYHQVWTVNFGTQFSGQQILKKGPIQLRFADNYTAKIPAIFRYKLPRNQPKIKMVHREFTDFYNLIDSLLIPISKSVMVSTATQYTGEEFFQGGLNSFRRQLLDQLQYGIYVTEPQIQTLEPSGSERIQYSSMPDRKATLKIWKPIKDKEGELVRMDNPLVTYGIEVTQVELGVPVPEQELSQLLTDKKRFDRIANEKADELAMVLENQKINLAKIETAKKTQLAEIEKDKQTHLAHIQKQTEIDKSNKIKELVLVKEEEKIDLAKKAKNVALLQKQLDIVQAQKDIEKANEEKQLTIAVAIAKAKKEEELALALATTQAKKEEEIIIAKANEKIQLIKKAEQLAVEREDEKIQLARVEREKKIQLATKAKELAIVEEEKKTHLAQIEKQRQLELAQKAEELAIVQEEQKIQLAEVEKQKQALLAKKAKELALVEEEKKLQLANKAKELALIEEEQKIQLAQKAKELAIVETEQKIQLAQKAKELAVVQANLDIQKTQFDVAQFEAKTLREKGLAEAEVLKAKYEARIPNIYLAELKKDIAQIMYPNLKGITVTMPHNIVNLGNQDGKLQTNLDVLSSFATLGVMEKLEKKAIDTQTPK
jgi:hypothetical protein